MNIVTTAENSKSGIDLTSEEAQLLQCFRRTTGLNQGALLQFAENFCEPRQPKKPSLRVVNGGAA